MTEQNLSEQASSLGRLVRRLELGANGGLPNMVLAEFARMAARAADNLADALDDAPDERFEMDSTLSDASAQSLADGLGQSRTPDSPEGL